MSLKRNLLIWPIRTDAAFSSPPGAGVAITPAGCHNFSMTDDDDNLPAPTTFALSPFEPQQPITILSSITEVQENDMVYVNKSLEAIRKAWGCVYDVDSVCKLAFSMSKILELRRKTLGMPYKKEPDPDNSIDGDPFD